MELREWIGSEHDGVLTRFERSIIGIVPPDRWRDAAGDGGSSIAYLLFHTAYHEDLAVGGVLDGGVPQLASWRDRLGVGSFDPAAGLGEAEDRALTSALDLDALLAYVRAVHDATSAWIAGAGDGDLDAAVDSAGGLERAGVTEPAVPWLYSMWAGQPASFFVQWEAIGHRINHVGEMVSVRNRLGLSPF